MSIFKGFYRFDYYVDYGQVDLKKFSSFSDLEKGKFLMSQYISLLEINSYKIKLSHVFDLTNNINVTYKNTSNLFIREYCDQLDYFFKTWSNQIDTSKSLNKTILSIVQWLRGDINLDPSIKLFDLFFFMNSSDNKNNCFVRSTYDNNLPLIIFYYFSKIKNMFREYYDVSVNNFEQLYPNKIQEMSSVLNGFMTFPYYNENYYEEEIKDFFYGLCDEYLFQSTDVSYKNLIFNKDKSILEIIFNSSSQKEELSLELVSYLIVRYDIGYTYDYFEESQLVNFKNIICDIKKQDGINFNGYTDNSNIFIRMLKNLVDNNLVNKRESLSIVSNLINKEKNEQEKIDSDAISNESLSLLSKVDKLIYRISMEDEDANDEEEEKSEDNIDDENIDESEGESEDSFEDDSDEFDSGSSEDDSYSSSGGGSYGNTDKPPIEVPKNKNANTSSSKGIKLELDVNPTFDTIMVKRELSVLIENLLIDEKLSPKQRMTLEGIKNKWMGLLTSQSIIDWMERTLNRTIFKKS